MHSGCGSDARSEAVGAALVLSGDDPLDGPDVLLENGCIEVRFAVSLRRFASARVFGNVGIHVRLKIALRLARQSKTPFRLTVEPCRSVSMARAT